MNTRVTISLHRLAAVAFVAMTWGFAPASAQPAAGKQVESIMTADGPISVQNVVGGLKHPWGMAFLPDGRLLVTEKAGKLRIVGLDGKLSDPVKGTPVVYAQGQGGLLDVALDPDFEDNKYVYLSYARPGPGGAAATALGRGRLVEDQIEDFQRLFTEKPWITGPNHFGGRIVFGLDGRLFLTLGERFQFQPAQDLSNHLGSVIRLEPSGSIPDDNPFVDEEDAEPAIWSYGHRNIEAAAIHPETGALWIAEMGPLGGDELNLVEPGRNYGWPVVSWGANYDGSAIPDPPTHPDFTDAVKHWSPVFSPSGMIVYTGDVFSQWKGDLFIGGLSAHNVVRLEMDGEQTVKEERIPLGARIRDIEQGPDGSIYVLTDEDDAHVWRLSPLK